MPTIETHAFSRLRKSLIALLVVTLDISATVFKILTHLARKYLVFATNPCLTPLAVECPAIST